MGIRRIARDDLANWYGLRRALWPDDPERDLTREVEAYFDGRSSLQVVFVAEGPSGEPLGMLELGLRSVAEGCRTAPVAYVEGWYVVPEVRRQGVGRALVAAAETWARERGHTELASDTLIDNLVGERAHLALGFEEVERAIHFRKDL